MKIGDLVKLKIGCTLVDLEMKNGFLIEKEKVGILIGRTINWELDDYMQIVFVDGNIWHITEHEIEELK